MADKNINIWMPQAVDRLLDKARARGKGNYSPAVCAAIYGFYEMLNADQREQWFERYDKWKQERGAAGDVVSDADQADEPAHRENREKTKEA